MNSERADSNLGAGDVAFALAMIVIAALVAILHWGATELSCAWDTSYCASSTEKHGVYEGVLQSLDGSPYRSAEFTVAFESREGLPPVSFRTDAGGRYCIQWASESIVPSARTGSGEPLANRGGEFTGLREWRDLEGGVPPPGCEEGDEGIPWNRAENADSTWQYWLLMVLSLATLLLLVSALFGRRSRFAIPCLVAGAVLLGIDLIVGAILWRFV